MEEHKQIERRRYDQEAAQFLANRVAPPPGAAGVPVEYRSPYTHFEREVVGLARPSAVVLDVGAGIGNFSLTARGEGRLLIATDISHVALRIAQKRAAAEGISLRLVCADAERLPFRSAAVDLVTTAGVLYCLNLESAAREIGRVLRSNGAWVIVDSLNDSPVYKLNRWIGFLRHRRTALAVRNVPTNEALQRLRGAFRRVSITYHGILSFLLPLLKPVLGPVRAASLVSAADRRLAWLRTWAFKVVVVAQHPQ